MLSGQCKSWIDDGLRPRAVTRDLDWGIPVPVEGAEGKVLYVWFDAPIGYISSTKEWAAEKGIDWEPYWKDDDTRLLHFIGKFAHGVLHGRKQPFGVEGAAAPVHKAADPILLSLRFEVLIAEGPDEILF